MVYTVTFNPSLDYMVTADGFEMGKTNRTVSEYMLPGGKGINVSVILSHLGVENTAIYFSAGFVGDEITRRVSELGIHAEEIRVADGVSRINVKLMNVEGTEINGKGPDISADNQAELYARLDGIKAGDVLVLAGSIPGSMPETIYSDIMEKLEGRGIRVVVDATKDLLMNVLKYRPFLVKPNNQELGEIFGVTLTTREEVVPYAKKLIELGAENVIVSMAGEGAAFVAKADGAVVADSAAPGGDVAASDSSAEGDNDYIVELREAPKGVLKNGVGAGDSMVGGFVAGFLESGDVRHAFRLGIASGSASAFSENLATRDEIMKVLEQVEGEHRA